MRLTFIIWSLLGNGESLFLDSSATLSINTTASKARHVNRSGYLATYEMTYQNYSFIGPNGTEFNYSVAFLKFKGDVTFEPGSVVNLTGAHALSIVSQEGNITVRTVIRADCANQTTEGNTCLGGYAVSSQPQKNYREEDVYSGRSNVFFWLYQFHSARAASF